MLTYDKADKHTTRSVTSINENHLNVSVSNYKAIAN